MPLLLIHFARYGPYHYARLRSAAEALGPLGWEVIGLETAGTDATYAWDDASGGESSPRVITAFPGRVYEEITAAEYRGTLLPLLDARAPDAMAIAGWGSTDAQLILSWCRKNDARRIVMSETREADGKRVWWKERIKRVLISRFDAALVGGKSHRDYLVKLGMPAEKIRFGYNVVDNAYFAEKTQDCKTQDAREEGCEERRRESGDRRRETGDGRRETGVRGRESEVGDRELAAISSSQLSEFQLSAFSSNYFLASNRFIERKNLSRLIEAYADYAQRKQESGNRGQEADGSSQHSSILNPSSPTWNLCLLGDGELKEDLIAQCQALGLNVIESAPWEAIGKAESGKRKAEMGEGDASSSFQLSKFQLSALNSPTVFFPGFRQIEELPRFYAHAGCFIHPALEEPWGLVINEAMACGLPVLSGNNVGAAEELVDDGVNGWKFDACDAGQMAQLMLDISDFNFPLSTFGDASRRILQERCATEAFGKGLAEILNR